MTEMTFMPNPEEVIARLCSVDLERFEQGDTLEREKLSASVSWLLVLLHCFDVQVLEKKERVSAEAAEREAGRLAAHISLELNQPATPDSLSRISELYEDLCDDVRFYCQEFDTGIAVKLVSAIKCPT